MLMISTIGSQSSSLAATTEMRSWRAACLKAQLDYSCKNAICLNAEAVAVVEGLRETARSIADEVGLFDETELRAQLPGEEVAPTLAGALSALRVPSTSRPICTAWTPRKPRVKAALLSIGRPATREEIAQRCGLDSNRIGSQLSVIPGVTRADKSRWGLAEWIDDELRRNPR